MAGLVLIVDDDAGFRALAVRILTTWGHEVIQAASAADALLRVQERGPHAVVADIGLPDGDGFTLTQQLIALPSPPCVVLISTDDDAGNESTARRAGALAFVPKHELLQGGLRQLLDGRMNTSA